MSDLISRQAAIAHAISGRTRELDGEKWIRVSEVRESLQTMPSAQQWIPCSERMPDGRLNKSYLVQDKDGRRAVGTYTNWGWMFGHYMNDPVAWMPLPEPYKGREDE